MRVDPAALAELADLRQRLPELAGSVLATVDGMLMAHDAHNLEPEGVAALSAAHLGLAQRFADAVAHGGLRETVVECTNGYITTYAAGAHALLTLVTRDGANLARVHLEGRRSATRLGRLVVPQPSPAPGPPPPGPVSAAPPLARRTPMATLTHVPIPRGIDPTTPRRR